MDVVAIMPCRGRAEQTVANVRRLLAMAGPSSLLWRLVCVVDNDREVYEALGMFGTGEIERIYLKPDQGGYWNALTVGSALNSSVLLCNLANDLLPGRHWLARGLQAYQARFGDGDGLMGFNDGLHGPEHSSHFLISRNLLTRYSGWPVHYHHNFGDTELCRRAQEDGLYGKAPWAVLFHDHLENGASDDAVYQEGRKHYARDAALFEERRKRGWPAL